MPPIEIQFFAPKYSVPKARFISSSKTAATAAGLISFLTRFRSRSHEPRAQKAAMPASRSTTCFSILRGVELAQTDIPIVHRKKAIASTSKPVRPMARITIK